MTATSWAVDAEDDASGVNQATAAATVQRAMDDSRRRRHWCAVGICDRGLQVPGAAASIAARLVEPLRCQRIAYGCSRVKSIARSVPAAAAAVDLAHHATLSAAEAAARLIWRHQHGGSVSCDGVATQNLAPPKTPPTEEHHFEDPIGPRYAGAVIERFMPPQSRTAWRLSNDRNLYCAVLMQPWPRPR
jgi:hypothetical protein